MKATETRERVVVRMAGDSGDGMQLAGSRFTDATAVFGNDLATLPDFPAEIRAPAGTVAGVSAFQIHFASRDILTPGDTPATVPAGARISAGKSGSVARSLPKTAVASVKRLPASCIPSPESPAIRTTTRSRVSVAFTP